MTSRRYFLIQGALASTAILACKPLTTIARTTSYFTSVGGSYGRLAFLHTPIPDANNNYKVIQCINKIKSNTANAVLIKTRKVMQDEAGLSANDDSILSNNELPEVNADYKIIIKGNIKTGIISAKKEDSDVIQKVNTLSAYLKKEKKCTIVVCLSQLGYKNINTPDDIMLAKKSTHLDIIIGEHANNFHAHAMIALNSKDGEVIIHSTAGNPTAIGEIGIDFDGHGRKKHITITNHS